VSSGERAQHREREPLPRAAVQRQHSVGERVLDGGGVGVLGDDARDDRSALACARQVQRGVDGQAPSGALQAHGIRAGVEEELDGLERRAGARDEKDAAALAVQRLRGLGPLVEDRRDACRGRPARGNYG
jgi:hypothetical protein